MGQYIEQLRGSFLTGVVDNSMGMTVQIPRKGSEIAQGFHERSSWGDCESFSVSGKNLAPQRCYESSFSPLEFAGLMPVVPNLKVFMVWRVTEK